MPASVISPSAATIASLGSAPVLKADEHEQLELVREHFSDPTFALPEHGKAGQPLTALLPGERYWLSKECFLRYLQSSKGDARQAIPRIQATLLWRREIGVDEIAANEVESEGVCGKAYLLGYSTQAEPLFYITPSRRDTDPSERQFRHLVWLWERCCDLMGPGVDGAVVLLNFAGKSKRPSVSLSTRVLSMMTHHYPQRVAAAYVRNTPLMLNAFLTVVWPFIDPATKDKVDMKGQVGGRIDSAVLIGDWGGELDFTYDHATYQPYLLQLAGAKRQAAISRWQAAGAELGASEYDVRRWDDGVGVPTRSAASSFDDNAVDAKHVVGDASELDVPILV